MYRDICIKSKVPSLLQIYILNSVPGLGTSTSKEAKEYFADMEKHRITFRYSGAEDDAAITLVSFIRTLHPVLKDYYINN